MSEVDNDKPGFVISYFKQTSALGEQITVNTSLPFGATEDQLFEVFTSIGNALHRRMLVMNDAVLKRTGKTLQDMELDPGTVYAKEEE